METTTSQELIESATTSTVTSSTVTSVLERTTTSQTTTSQTTTSQATPSESKPSADVTTGVTDFDTTTATNNKVSAGNQGTTGIDVTCQPSGSGISSLKKIPEITVKIFGVVLDLRKIFTVPAYIYTYFHRILFWNKWINNRGGCFLYCNIWYQCQRQFTKCIIDRTNHTASWRSKYNSHNWGDNFKYHCIWRYFDQCWHVYHSSYYLVFSPKQTTT